MTYLDLQDVITADALVMHIMVSIIGITAILVLDEGEASNASVRHTQKMTVERLTVCCLQSGVREYRNGSVYRSCRIKSVIVAQDLAPRDCEGVCDGTMARTRQPAIEGRRLARCKKERHADVADRSIEGGRGGS